LYYEIDATPTAQDAGIALPIAQFTVLETQHCAGVESSMVLIFQSSDHPMTRSQDHPIPDLWANHPIL